ncbi:MAG: glycosyltransferase [Bacillota bacterium]
MNFQGKWRHVVRGWFPLGTWSAPRIIATSLIGWLLIAVGTTDWVAGTVACGGVIGVWLVLRRQGRRTVRLAAAALIGALLASLTIATLATYDFRARPSSELITPSADIRGAVIAHRQGPRIQVLGFVAPDFDDTQAGLQHTGAVLSDVAATRLTLSKTDPGQLNVLSVGSGIPLQAHINGAHAELIVSNFDGNDFNPKLAMQVLANPTVRQTLVTNLVSQVQATSPDWDGIVLDLENLPASAAPYYPMLVSELRSSLDQIPGKVHRPRIYVAIPAVDQPNASDIVGYAPRRMGQLADRVIWMAMDQHSVGSSAGPVGGLPWVTSSLDYLLTQVPAKKVLLSIAGYGYKWPPHGDATSVRAADLGRFLHRSGAVGGWDATQAEDHYRLVDGSQIWFSNASSFQIRAKLAVDRGLAGVAIWRLGAESPNALSLLPGRPIKYGSLPLGDRSVKINTSQGLVALTFDDGPDPTWTPQILSVLEQEGVPGTFFDIGKEVLANPQLAQREYADGDVVGSHTFSHANLDQIPRWRQYVELLGGQIALEGATGELPVLFRPPYGSGDAIGSAGTSADQLAAKLGLVEVDWTDDPQDWAPGSKAPAIVSSVMSQAATDTIVLLHDGGGNRSQTVIALRQIIHRFRALGYHFVTADQLIGGMDSPYKKRAGLASRVVGGVLIASFRLARSVQVLLEITALVLMVVGLIRLAVVVPLAIYGARRGRRRRSTMDPEWSAGVSVVVPAYNEAAVIEKTLAALLALQGNNAPHEIIVVDDGSTDGTGDIAERFSSRVRVIRKVNGGKASALNLGIQEARNEIVLVLDADTVIGSTCISMLRPHFADPGVVAVAGNVRVGNRRKLLPRLQAIEYVASLSLDRRAQDVLNTISVVPGAAGAFRRSAVLAVGGYPGDTLVEDADLTIMLLQAGGKIHYEPAAVVWTEAPQRLRDAIKQRRRWAFGTVQVCAKHAHSLLARGSGRVGLVSLPWTVLTQIVLPIASPVTDFYLLWIFLTGTPERIVWIALLVAMVADLIVVALVILAEHEEWRLLWVVPMLRWVWRPIQVFAVLSASSRWARGEEQRWHPSARFNTVVAPAGGLQPSGPNQMV